ncbi:hypothetical protein V1517DRAFT_162191 [Lipomyces orientalis]|uniref:Uncharacterized protein n=1 Tax=Lipomyces orientalis TaxID=1233043 RepID=A0ACC3TLJ1_9ASCO
MQFGMLESAPRDTRFRLPPDFDGMVQSPPHHPFFDHTDRTIPPHLGPPHFWDKNGTIPPCDFLNKRFAHGHFTILVLSFTIFFLLRRLEWPRRRLSIWLLDFLRQSIAAIASKFLFVIVFYMSMDYHVYTDPMLCRLPVVSFFFETVIGLPMLYWIYRGVFAVARRISLGRARYILNDEVTRVGLQSGNYGNPIRVTVFLKQTLLLCCASIVSKFFESFLLYSARSFDRWLVMILLGWTWQLGNGAEILMAAVVYPLVFWTIQYIITDRIIRYSPQSTRKSQGDVEAQDRRDQDEEAVFEGGQRATVGEERGVPLQERVATGTQPEIANSREPSSPRYVASRLSSSSQAQSLQNTAEGIEHQDRSAIRPSQTSSSSGESSRYLASPSSSRHTSILTTLLTAPRHFSSPTSSSSSSTAATTVTRTVAPPSYLPPPMPVPCDPLEVESDAEEELPTYADSQRQALESRDRDRQRILDLKRQ